MDPASSGRSRSRETIFTVPTLTFGVLYCFIVNEGNPAG
jgi:hypothetical protein